MNGKEIKMIENALIDRDEWEAVECIRYLQSRLESLEKDAARWKAATRDYTINDIAVVRYDALGDDWVVTGDDADKAIDAAMKG